MKILSVVGARPQFIKAFAVSGQLREDHEEILVHTGQHYDEELSAVFFEDLDIPEPAYNLGVGSAPPGRQTGEMMIEFEPVLVDEDPDVVIVYGDTNSTLAAAMVAAKADTVLAHVEAGLRSDNREMPEEHNRVLTDHAADILLAPTLEAVENLDVEGLDKRTFRTGDVMFDTLLWARDQAQGRATVRSDLGLGAGEYLLATVHRAANTNDHGRLRSIVDAFLARPEPVVFPAHPRTVDALESAGELERVRDGLTLIEPVGYLEFVDLLDAAHRVLTDSGGVQKEAFFLETPCVTLRGETEWPETLTGGWNVLAGADGERIHQAIERSIDPSQAADTQPYGDGTAATTIQHILESEVGRQRSHELYSQT
jgi:UDP-N-acetylglucosamine 2-epimerase (non-hydrolysing)